MTCVICKHGDLQPRLTRAPLSREDTTIVFEAVPASVCDTCGEIYLSADVVDAMQKALEQAHRDRVTVAIRQFQAA